MGSVREERVLCNLASRRQWLRLSGERLGVSSVPFVLSKQPTRYQAYVIHRHQAVTSFLYTLLNHNSQAPKCMSLRVKQPLQLIQFRAETYFLHLTRIERGNTYTVDIRAMRQQHVEVLP